MFLRKIIIQLKKIFFSFCKNIFLWNLVLCLKANKLLLKQESFLSKIDISHYKKNVSCSDLSFSDQDKFPYRREKKGYRVRHFLLLF